MPVLRSTRRVLPITAAIWLCAAAAAPGAAWARRVGFANVARDGAAGQAAIAGLRGPVTQGGKLDDLGDGQGRRALEAPVDPAAAPDAAGVARARKLLASAQEAYAAFEYDTALDRLRQAEAALRTVAPSPDAVAALADLNLLAGLVHAARGDDERAVDAFRLVRRLAPDRTALDPGLYRPQLVALYDRAGAAPEGNPGVVVVSTEPAGATVWVDGRAVGTAPVELPAVPPGEHYLAATLDGHATRVDRVRVEGGRRVEQSFLLARLPAEERARAVRASLLRPGVVEGDWPHAAQILADVASVDVLVLVRQRDDGALEGAVYDVRAGRLAAWVSLDEPARLVEELPRPSGDPIAVPRPDEVARKTPGGDPLVGGVRGGRKPPPRAPWYRTWWGVAALIGGGVALTATVIAVSADEPPAGPGIDFSPGWLE